MNELFFVLKCLVFTAVVVIFMQLKVGGTTIEGRTYRWLQRSGVSVYLQSVAAGGALAIKNLSVAVKDGVVGTVDDFQHGASEQKAQR